MKKTGFTLIEILVVLLIIGISLGFALLSFGDFGEKRRVIAFAEQFTSYLKLAQHQAIVEANTLGIRFTNPGYQLIRFTAANEWKPMVGLKFFNQQQPPRFIVMHLDFPNPLPNNPAITINPTGELSLFQISFGTLQQPSMAIVTNKPGGILAVKTGPSP